MSNYKFKEMGHLTHSTKSLFNEAKVNIQTENFGKFYSDTTYPYDQVVFGEATQLLIQAGIDPLKTLNEVPDNYLMGNWNLLEITIPDNINVIGESAFAECEYLNKVILPKELVEIRDNAFNTCSSLNSIVLPKSLRKIGINNFYFCENLNTVVYEGTKEEFKNIEIDDDCFKLCPDLDMIKCSDSSIYFDDNNYELFLDDED